MYIIKLVETDAIKTCVKNHYIKEYESPFCDYYWVSFFS